MSRVKSKAACEPGLSCFHKIELFFKKKGKKIQFAEDPPGRNRTSDPVMPINQLQSHALPSELLEEIMPPEVLLTDMSVFQPCTLQGYLFT
jgi:hypothetical protein